MVVEIQHCNCPVIDMDQCKCMVRCRGFIQGRLVRVDNVVISTLIWLTAIGEHNGACSTWLLPGLLVQTDCWGWWWNNSRQHHCSNIFDHFGQKEKKRSKQFKGFALWVHKWLKWFNVTLSPSQKSGSKGVLRGAMLFELKWGYCEEAELCPIN